MEATIRLDGEGGADGGVGDELRSLHGWLTCEEEFRGRVRLVESPPPPNALGSWPEAITVALGQGGAASMLVWAVVTWLRSRTSDITVRLTGKDGRSLEVAAKQVRSLDAEGVRGIVVELQRGLDDGTSVQR